ncbi:ABC transporter permease [Pseudonocardia endophytica]|uniref:Transport permease protein n=1 Tax=Pseudonocardia endophytica TaxID=401976 RepID=A0A4R1HP01_PSEEN|nr:ABC transporter permease [Pseudonocardia endophytica]TCK21439.1 ABC-2 type transport system permease protein [Pseudonocardia endophytica]
MTTIAAAPTARPQALRDSLTMVRRRLLHMRRYPSLTIMLIGQPLVFLLLFVYVLGGPLGAGVAGPTAGRTQYLAYITPTILLITVASIALATAIGVATDMTEGVVARFRTMAIARVSVLTGHVVGAFAQTVVALVVVTGVALALGFRTDATVGGWLGALGILALLTLALTWLTVALGLAARTVESASNTPMFLLLLPFLSSGFVPTESMPTVLRWFAEYQPFTPVIDALRGLLLGSATPGLGTSVMLAVGWCVVITVAGYLWAERLYNSRTDG